MKALLALLLLTTPVLAQQPPDPDRLQKAIAILQQQRNQAMDALAGTQVDNQKLQDELTKLKKELADAQQKSSTSPNDGGSSPQPSVR